MGDVMRNRFLPLLFVIITFFTGFNIMIVKEKNEFSVTENRDLSQIEQFSISGWTAGSFQESVENTLADHFLAKEYFVKFSLGFVSLIPIVLRGSLPVCLAS